MPFSTSTKIALLSLLSSAAYGFTNDWTEPCFDGTCSYSTDLGSFKIWGSPDAITDITAVAGWEILNCDPNALVQDIRLVCTNPSGCEHFYQASGPVGKLVRLPQNCGASAFARIARNWVHEDQSLPTDLANTLRRRDGTAPEVQGLALDTDFAAVDPAQNGDVNIAIEGSNVPGATGNATVVPPPARRSRLRRRGFLKDIFNKFNSFDKDVTKALPPIDVDQTFPIFDNKISCPANGNIPAFDAGIKADVVAKAHAVVTLGMGAHGTIIPPNLDEFGVFVGLDADLTGTLELVGSASGTADSGKISLFQVGIPGLDFPGILTLGPTFKIQGQATANLDIDAQLSVDLAYHVDNAKLFFPPSSDAASNGGFSPLDSPLKLSVSPDVNSSATVAAHLIPTIDLGVSALGGFAQATVFLDLDASVSTTLSLNGGAVADISTDGEKSASADVNGCVDVGAGFDVNAGADGSFFGLFDKSTQVNLFSKKFELFKKCLGASTAARRGVSAILVTGLEKRDLACPGFDPENLVSVAEEAISASSIVAL